MNKKIVFSIVVSLISIVFIVNMTYSNAKSINSVSKKQKEWYEDCNSSTSKNNLIKIYKNYFFNQLNTNWTPVELNHKIEPYLNKNSFFGNMKNVCRTTIVVDARSKDGLDTKKFETNISVMFEGIKNELGQDMFKIRIDSTKELKPILISTRDAYVLFENSYTLKCINDSKTYIVNKKNYYSFIFGDNSISFVNFNNSSLIISANSCSRK